MDQPFVADTTFAAQSIDDPAVESTSRPYLGRWNHLVSTTNWEKGRIICEWREALLAAGAAAPSYTDEAWSRRVGSLTPQHCGRLRRVWQRFGKVRDQYPGLYWSHFQAALEWSDAEMWLEGAVQNGWSVARMSEERGTTLDGLETSRPDELPADPWDEDADVGQGQPPEAISSSQGEVHDAADAEGDEADAQRHDTGEDVSFDAAGLDAEQSPAEAVRPFEGLPPLPTDLADALEAFKLAIVRHRQAGWKDISRGQVLAVLDALRRFALSPAVL